MYRVLLLLCRKNVNNGGGSMYRFTCNETDTGVLY
jgi:hypothetical protein